MAQIHNGTDQVQHAVIVKVLADFSGLQRASAAPFVAGSSSAKTTRLSLFLAPQVRQTTRSICRKSASVKGSCHRKHIAIEEGTLWGLT